MKGKKNICGQIARRYQKAAVGDAYLFPVQSPDFTGTESSRYPYTKESSEHQGDFVLFFPHIVRPLPDGNKFPPIAGERKKHPAAFPSRRTLFERTAFTTLC
ncbi:MAG: hypothetical protein LBK66_14790 [Spirochaetaceae bacterium]|jgi:hypothetical protein|nr:hypothetical protein [Spirochaetaceae bacterium]